jgi:hypothetical protein
MAAAIAWADSDSIVSTGTTFTHSGVAIGTEAADRGLGLAIKALKNGATADITGVTVDGEAAQKIVTRAAGSSDGAGLASIWVLASKPTGTTADIEVTASGNLYNSHIDVFAITGADLSAAVDTGEDSFINGAEHDGDLGLDVPAGGIAFGGVICFALPSNPNEVVWSGFTERSELNNIFGNTHPSAADYAAADAQAPLAVGISFPNIVGGAGNTMAAVAASFGPAAEPEPEPPEPIAASAGGGGGGYKRRRKRYYPYPNVADDGWDWEERLRPAGPPERPEPPATEPRQEAEPQPVSARPPGGAGLAQAARIERMAPQPAPASAPRAKPALSQAGPNEDEEWWIIRRYFLND